MGKIKIIIFSFCFLILIVLSVSLANIFKNAYYLFYNGIYGIILSTIIPLALLYKNKESLSAIGFKRLYFKEWLVLIIFVSFSVCGQIIPLIVTGTAIRWHLLPTCFFPMVMTTFFEEFLFRGFIQTKIEKQFSFIIAVFVSGLMFSLYHIGYPGFRSINDLLLLFAVGLGFAIAFKLSGNNLYVSYFVNLPNAFVTYLLKSEQFPVLGINSTIYAIATIILIVTFLSIYNKKQIKYNTTVFNEAVTACTKNILEEV
jgi:membrane protease YdiL (CAAX protease family)